MNRPDKIAERGLGFAVMLLVSGIALVVASIWFSPWPLWAKTLASGVFLFAAGLMTGSVTQK